MCSENEAQGILSVKLTAVCSIPYKLLWAIRFRVGCILTKWNKFLKKNIMKEFIFHCWISTGLYSSSAWHAKFDEGKCGVTRSVIARRWVRDSHVLGFEQTTAIHYLSVNFCVIRELCVTLHAFTNAWFLKKTMAVTISVTQTTLKVVLLTWDTCRQQYNILTHFYST